jgi:hypothetical protein
VVRKGLDERSPTLAPSDYNTKRLLRKRLHSSRVGRLLARIALRSHIPRRRRQDYITPCSHIQRSRRHYTIHRHCYWHREASCNAPAISTVLQRHGRCATRERRKLLFGNGSRRAGGRERSHTFSTLREDVQAWELQSRYTLISFIGRVITL